jgi:hypothetical protein
LEGAAKFLKVSVKDGEVVKTVKSDGFNQGKASTPNLVDFEVSGDTLFALFQRSENYTYPAPGLLALYKLKDGTLLDTIKLAKKNPMAMGFASGKLYVASQGEYNEAYGTDADDKHKPGTDITVCPGGAGVQRLRDIPCPGRRSVHQEKRTGAAGSETAANRGD